MLLGSSTMPAQAHHGAATCQDATDVQRLVRALPASLPQTGLTDRPVYTAAQKSYLSRFESWYKLYSQDRICRFPLSHLYLSALDGTMSQREEGTFQVLKLPFSKLLC